jgi:hypothetical protein
LRQKQHRRQAHQNSVPYRRVQQELEIMGTLRRCNPG